MSTKKKYEKKPKPDIVYLKPKYGLRSFWQKIFRKREPEKVQLDEKDLLLIRALREELDVVAIRIQAGVCKNLEGKLQASPAEVRRIIEENIGEMKKSIPDARDLLRRLKAAGETMDRHAKKILESWQNSPDNIGYMFDKMNTLHRQTHERLDEIRKLMEKRKKI